MQNQIDTVRSQYSFLTRSDSFYVASFAQMIGLAIVILLELSSVQSAIWQVIGYMAMAFLFATAISLCFYALSFPQIRKLYYFCDLQKTNLRKQYKEQEKRNKSKGSCICEVKKCHRCRGEEWHSRIFFSDENLCFRCGIPERSE